MLPRWSEPLLALALGALLALAVAGPDLAQLGTRVWGWENNDGLQAVYLHFSFHDAMAAGRVSLHDPNTMLPTGAYRAHQDGGNSLEMVLSGALRWLRWPLWFNVAALAWIPINLLAFLPLGKELWGKLGPALAAGAAWAILPPVLMHLGAGRHTQAVLFGVPLAVVGMLWIARDAGRKGWLVAGIGMALTAAAYWFYGIAMVLLAPCFAVLIWRQRGRDGALDLLKAAGVALVVSLPFTVPLILSATQVGEIAGNPAIPGQDLTDALLLDPSRREPHLSGWMPWVLVPGLALSAWKGERRLLWGALCVGCVLLGLGPAQTLGETRWLLPAHPIYELPMLNHMLHPSRFLVLGGVFFVVAAADGLARWKPALMWLLPAGVLAQGWLTVLPLGTWSIEKPLWDAVAEQAGPGILVVPLLQSGTSVSQQPFHGRRMLGGMTENLPWTWTMEFRNTVDGNALLSTLDRYSKGTDRALPVYQQDLDALRALGVDTVVLDQSTLERLPDRIRYAVPLEQRLTEAMGAPLYAGPDGAIWSLPERGQPGAPPDIPGSIWLDDIAPDGSVR